MHCSTSRTNLLQRRNIFRHFSSSLLTWGHSPSVFMTTPLASKLCQTELGLALPLHRASAKRANLRVSVRSHPGHMWSIGSWKGWLHKQAQSRDWWLPLAIDPLISEVQSPFHFLRTFWIPGGVASGMYLQLIKSDPSCKSPASSNKQVLPCDQPSPPILSFEPVTMHSCPWGCGARFHISLVCKGFFFYDKKFKHQDSLQKSRRSVEPTVLELRAFCQMDPEATSMPAGFGGCRDRRGVHVYMLLRGETRQDGLTPPLLFLFHIIWKERLFGNTVLTRDFIRRVRYWLTSINSEKGLVRARGSLS